VSPSSAADHRRGYLALVGSVLALGTAPLFVRAISAPALTIAMYASWIAAGASLVIARLTRAKITRSVLIAAIPGGIAFALAQLLAFSAFQETSLAIASLITTMTPLLVVVAAVPLFGEKLRGVQILWASLALAGVAAVVLGAKDDGHSALLGDVLAVGSLVAGAAVILFMKHRRMEGEGGEGVAASAYTAAAFLVGALVETPVWLAVGDRGDVSGTEWLWLVLLAVVSLTAGMGALAWAQRHVGVAVSSVISSGATVVTAAGAWMYFDQTLQVPQVVGGLVVLLSLGGIVLAEFAAPKPAVSPSA
jgi:DME family drug/metabolite transporter